MTLLGPGIRKKNEDLIKSAEWNLLLQYFNGVVAEDAQIRQFLLLDREQQASHARSMDFDSEVVALRVRLRERREVIPIAEADFHDPGRRAAKERVKIQMRCREGDAELWPQLIQRALLRRRHAPG